MFIVDEVILNIHSTYYWHYKYLATSFHSVLVQLLNQIHDPRLALSTVQSLPRQVVSMMMIQSTELLFAFHRHPSIDRSSRLWDGNSNYCGGTLVESMRHSLLQLSVRSLWQWLHTYRNHHLEIISQTSVSHDYHSTVKSPPRSSLYFVVCRKSFNRWFKFHHQHHAGKPPPPDNHRLPFHIVQITIDDWWLLSLNKSTHCGRRRQSSL